MSRRWFCVALIDCLGTCRFGLLKPFTLPSPTALVNLQEQAPAKTEAKASSYLGNCPSRQRSAPSVQVGPQDQKPKSSDKEPTRVPTKVGRRLAVVGGLHKIWPSLGRGRLVTTDPLIVPNDLRPDCLLLVEGPMKFDRKSPKGAKPSARDEDLPRASVDPSARPLTRAPRASPRRHQRPKSTAGRSFALFPLTRSPTECLGATIEAESQMMCWLPRHRSVGGNVCITPQNGVLGISGSSPRVPSCLALGEPGKRPLL